MTSDLWCRGALLEGCALCRSRIPRSFAGDVVRVARNREPGVHLKQIAADFGISESCLTNWMKTADVEDGVKPGTAAAENAELREARKRIRLLEQER